MDPVDLPRRIPLPECPTTAREDQPRRQHAGALFQDAKNPQRGRKGKIRQVNRAAYTYDVVVDGGTQPVTMGRLMSDFNDATLLPIGATVAISYEYGQPLIIGVIPITASRDAAPSTTPSISNDAAGQETDTPPESAYCRLPHLPENLLPNDKVLVSPDGNMVGALSGGINTMKSGMAQIRTHMQGDLAEIICRNYRHISDFGITEIKNTDGKVGLTLRGGTDQTNECGSDQENWTVRLDINGDDLFRFELTSATGTTLFKLAVDNDGKVEIYGADGVDLGGGRSREETILGDHTVSVGGDESKTVAGAQKHIVTGNRQATTSGSETRVIGNDLTESAIRHVTESVGGNHIETITGGNPLVATPLNVARKTRVVNGSWEIDIGNPLSGANPAALAGFKVSTFSGDIDLAVKVLGNISFHTLVGNATLETKAGIASLKSAVGPANVDGTIVQLGPMAGAIQPLILGIPYSSALTAFLTTVIAACSAASGAITEPGLVGFTAALNAAASALLGQIPSMLSTKSFTA
jgi:hypothetical protein